MDWSHYHRQVVALRADHLIHELLGDPYDISAATAKQLFELRSLDTSLAPSATRLQHSDTGHTREGTVLLQVLALARL